MSWTPAGRRQGTDTCSSSSRTFSSTSWEQLIKGTGSRVEIDGVSHGRHLGRDRGQIHAQALPGLSLPPGGQPIKGLTDSQVEIDGVSHGRNLGRDKV